MGKRLMSRSLILDLALAALVLLMCAAARWIWGE